MVTSEGDRPSALAHVWVMRSRHDLSPLGADLRGLRSGDLFGFEASSHPTDLSCPSSHVQSVTRAFWFDVHPLCGEAVSPSSREVFGPSTLAEADSDLHRGCLPRLCNAFRVSHPLDALLRLLPLRPCFMPVTPLGFHFQRVPPPGSRPPFDVLALLAVSYQWLSNIRAEALLSSPAEPRLQGFAHPGGPFPPASLLPDSRGPCLS
jgi:hypothetical protein